MQPLSTYSALLTQNNAMINTSKLTTKLSQELSTGQRAVDLADNPDRQTVLDLTMTKNDKEAYVKSCTLGQITTSQYTVSLQHIESIATTALKSVQDLMSGTHGLTSTNNPNDSGILSQYKTLSTTITTALQDLTISLNEQSSSGGGYLYGGLRAPSGIPTYSLPPVRDLNTLPYFSSSDGTAANPASPATPYSANDPAYGVVQVDPTVTASGGLNPGLPVYDANFNPSGATLNGVVAQAVSPATTAGGQAMPTPIDMAWGVQKLTIDSKETVNLNITSTAPAFQNLINGLRAAKTAADQAANYVGPVDANGNPTSIDRDKFMSLAFSSLTRSINGGLDPTNNTWDAGLRDLEQQNSLTELSMQTKSQVHTNDLNVINTRLDSLVGVDTTTVTVQLATANNQLQASYKATASLLGMSLMNYLK